MRGRDEHSLRFFTQDGARWIPAVERGQGMLLQTRWNTLNPLHGGALPISSGDGLITMVFDGEIYGWEAHRAELEALGHGFQTGSGVEMVLHGYEQWGEQVLTRMRGKFAFAILDLNRQVIFCARDPLGEKPLYWRWDQGVFSFASGLRALRELDIHEHWDVSAAGIDAYLAHGYIPAPQSIYRDVYKLPAAHRMTVSLRPNSSAPVPLPYWSPKPELLDPSTTLDEAIRSRISGERKLGLLISGNTSSQAVAAGCVRDLTTGLRVTAFTGGFVTGENNSGVSAAQSVAQRLGLACESLDFMLDVDDLPQIVRDLDEPFGNPSALLMWHIARAASSSVSVGLTGIGGGEMFAALPRYWEHLKAHAASGRKGWKSLLPSSPPKEWKSKGSLGGRMQRMAAEARMDWTDAYVLRFGGIEPIFRAFLQPNSGSLPPHYWRMPSDESATPLEWMVECDRLNLLPECGLRQNDLCGMVHGLSLRSPLVDDRFLAAVLALPLDQRFAASGNGWLEKYAGQVMSAAEPAPEFELPVPQWNTHPSWKGWMSDCPRQLEVMTNGQISASRCSAMLNDSDLPHQTVWQLVGLRLSLESLISEI